MGGGGVTRLIQINKLLAFCLSFLTLNIVVKPFFYSIGKMSVFYINAQIINNFSEISKLRFI
jgi:hypothetical protein